MTSPADLRSPATPSAAHRLFAAAVVLLCSLVLVGWFAGRPTLTSVVPGMVTMKVNTAVGLILLAAAVAAVNGRSAAARLAVWGCLAAVALLAGLTLVEFVAGVDLRIDNLLVRDATITRFPGRNAPATDAAFLGLAAALGLLRLDRGRRSLTVAQVLFLVVAAAPLATLGGYLYHAPALFQNAPYPTVALNTSVCLLLLCLAGLSARSDGGLMAVVTSDSLAGSVGRRLLPAAVGVPLAAGLLVVLGERAGLYTPEFGSALLVAGCGVFFAAAVCWTVLLLSSAEAARRLAERRTAEGGQRLRIAVETAGLGSWEYDPATGTIDCNDRCKADFGFAPGDRFDFPAFAAAVHPGDRDRVTAALAAAQADRADYHAEYRVAWPDGSPHWVLASGRGVYDDATGGLVRMVGVTLDRTAAKAAEADRERLLDRERAARGEAERANRLKDEFLAVVSHELRTPLNAILGWAQILRGGDNTADDLTQGLETIERNARAQVRLIEDILDMGRIISGNVRLELGPVSVAAVVAAAVDAVRPAAGAKGIELTPTVDPLAGPVRGDAARLQQVVWNLLNNAIKFTPRGGRVSVAATRAGDPTDNRVEVAVADTGEGIGPDFLPHVFERFRQADGSTTRRFGGLGLGLSIVKQLVDLHGGTVRLVSPGLGLGSTFTVSLPVAAADGAGRQAGTAPSSATDRTRLSGLRLLVVDDEPDARALIARLLTDAGGAVRTAGSAAEAMTAFDADRPDVLVSDIGMPAADGYELIRRVRAAGGVAVPAVAVTAYARVEDRVRVLRAGFQTYVVKPVDASELVAVVASLVGRSDGERCELP